jgi:outer membrane lipoprotein carrier protein
MEGYNAPMRALPLLLLLLAPAAALPVSMDELFGRMQASQDATATMEARFEQVKRSSLLAGEAVSQGVMYYRKPDLIRWEYLAPDPFTILIEGDHFSAYYPDLHKLKTARVARLRHRVFNFLVATEPLEKLKTHFQVELREGGSRPTWTLVLTPLTPMIRKTVARITVLVDKKTSLPAELSIEEADGDSTRIRFTDLAVNQPLPDGIFRLQVPPGTVEEPYTAGNR